MSVHPSRKLAILERRQKAADLYIQGWTQMEIAKHVGVDQTTISDDLMKVRAEWRESAVRDFDEARDLELKKIDRVEREAWAAWDRSQKPAQSATTSDETHQRRTRRHVRNQYGDPRFLEQINKCIASRCALLGLGIARIEEGSDGFTFDERRDRIVTVIAALRDRQGAAAIGEGPGSAQPGLLCADRVERTVDAGPPSGVPG